MFKNVGIKVLTKSIILKNSLNNNIHTLNTRAKGHIMGEQKAQGIIEYGLLLAIVAVALIGVITQLKNKIEDKLKQSIEGIK